MSRARNELSRRNQYYISKERYLELKHFCLQYPEWQKEYNQISTLPPSDGFPKIGDHSGGSFVETVAIKRTALKFKMDMVRRIAFETDSYLGPYIFKSVTEDRSYAYLCNYEDMACGVDMYYDRYHKFFWLLDQARD